MATMCISHLGQPQFGEILLCEREERNLEDPYAVAIVRNGVIVGHVHRTISCVCSLTYICVEEGESRVR